MQTTWLPIQDRHAERDDRLIRNVYSHLLLVGNAMDARDLRLLYDTGIAAVVDLAINEKPAQLGRELIYCRFPINDGDGNPDWLLGLAIQTIVSMVRNEIGRLSLVAPA